MRLESLLAATGGRLLNDPSVTRFESIALSPKKVERGTLFVAKNEADIPEALQRGAYAILAESLDETPDPEVAWIEVGALADALPRLLRLWLMEHPRTVHLVERETLAYMAQMAQGHGLLFLRGNPESMSEAILASRPDQTLLCADALFLDRLGVDYETPEAPAIGYEIVSKTLFETSALLEGVWHERLPVPPCTFGAFAQAYGLLKNMEVPFGLAHLHPIPAFDPVFLDAYRRPAPFGATQRAVVLADRIDTCTCLEAFDTATWLPRRIFLPSRIKLECVIKSPIEIYETNESLFARLFADARKSGFDLVAGMHREAFLDLLARHAVSTPRTDKGLF
ncbi:hypothetical protein [Hydrogenimonas sp.]